MRLDALAQTHLLFSIFVDIEHDASPTIFVSVRQDNDDETVAFEVLVISHSIFFSSYL